MPLAPWFATLLAIAPPDPAAVAEASPRPDDDERNAATVAEPARVVLLSGTRAREPALLARIRRTRAELDVSGFAVLEVTSTTDGVPTTAPAIEAWTAGTDPRVVAVFDAERVRAEVWLRTDSGELERIAIVVGDLGADDGDAVFAVRLAEVVRAVLIDVEPRAPPVPATPPEPAPVAAKVEEKAPIRWAARLGAHAIASSGRLGFMIGPTLGSTVMLGARRRVGLDLELLGSALEGRRATEAGTARVGFATARVHAGFWPVPLARVSPGFGVGMGVLVAWTRGQGNGTWIGRTDVTAVALPSVAADLAIVLTPRLRLRFGARLGVALPAVRVYAPNGTTRAAQPMFDGGLALEVAG